MSQEPSMEDILSSIKRIIAEDGDAISAARRARRAGRSAGEHVHPDGHESALGPVASEMSLAVDDPTPPLATVGPDEHIAPEAQEGYLSTLDEAFSDPDGQSAASDPVLELTQAIHREDALEASSDTSPDTSSVALPPVAAAASGDGPDLHRHGGEEGAPASHRAPWPDEPGTEHVSSARAMGVQAAGKHGAAHDLSQHDLTPKPSMLSEESARASRDSLALLSSMVVRGEEGESLTLEALVRDMLRPMLGEWLDANLPTLVENLVAREIARIAARNG